MQKGRHGLRNMIITIMIVRMLGMFTEAAAGRRLRIIDSFEPLHYQYY